MEPQINTDKHSRKPTHRLTHNLSLPPTKSLQIRRKSLVRKGWNLKMGPVNHCKKHADFEQDGSRTAQSRRKNRISPAFRTPPIESLKIRRKSLVRKGCNLKTDIEGRICLPGYFPAVEWVRGM